MYFLICLPNKPDSNLVSAGLHFSIKASFFQFEIIILLGYQREQRMYCSKGVAMKICMLITDIFTIYHGAVTHKRFT